MHSMQHQYPDLQTLADNISITLSDYFSLNGQVNILAREENSLVSTFPSEIVTCQLADGSKYKILCKYAVERSNNSYGHQNGLSYEAKVYRHVLQPLKVSSPKFYDSHHNSINEETWLILEYFDNSLLVKDSRDRCVMQAAANWLGRFHRLNESLLSRASLPFLNRYDAEYFLGWADRTSLFADHLHQRFPWLASLCKRFDQTVVTLLKPPLIIIHGEYYTNNIILSEGKIYPIDWESAAFGIGEIDLASLTEKWPSDFVNAAKAEYQRARWPEGTPADFEHKLHAAQLYWHFRWPGDRPEWTTKEKDIWRFEEIRLLGERLGLIKI
jgi:thiamine kinase-like enzyme